MSKNKFEKAEQELKEIIGDVEEKVEDVVKGVVKKVKKPFHRRPHFWIFAIFFIVIIILAILYFSLWNPIKDSINLARETQAQFEKVQTDLLSADFDQAKKDIQLAQKNLEKLEKNISQLDSPLMIGYLRNQYEAVNNIISATQEFSDGLYLLTELVQNVLTNVETKDGNLTISAQQRKDILEKFSREAPELNGAKAQIDLSLLALNEISVSKLNPQLGSYVIELRTKLSLLREFLNKSVNLSQALPTLLGLNSEKTYLFLLQNNNELRPTGGFIGTLGILKIKNGEIISFDTNNVYDYDKYAPGRLKVTAPVPIQKYLNVDGWYLRDSNWSPDFAEASKQIEWFYHQEANLSGGNLSNYNLDGIIAITPKIIEELLGVAGAIEVDSFVFNKDNFVERLQYLVEVGYEDQGVAYWQRKNIIGNLAKKLITRTENLNLNGWLNIITSLFDNLNQKHILVYAKDSLIQNSLKEQNWSGEINSTANDYLMVIDANLASLKSNQCVERTIKYTLDENLTAKVDIQYKNNCSFTWKSTRYRTYTRIYVPLNSELIKTTGSMEIDRSTKTGETDVSKENNKTVFGAFISIEPGKTGTLSFEYKLPKYLIDKISAGNEYNLYLQKQPGTYQDKMILDLNFPYEIQLTYPSENRTGWGDNSYKLTTNLEEDREVKIGF